MSEGGGRPELPAFGEPKEPSTGTEPGRENTTETLRERESTPKNRPFESQATSLDLMANRIQELAEDPNRHGEEFLRSEIAIAADRLRVGARCLYTAGEQLEKQDHPQTPFETESETARKELESAAISLGIPRENWGDSNVREFIDFYNQAEKLLTNLSVSSSQHLNRFSGQGEELGTHRTPGKPEKLAQLREQFGAPDMSLTLAGRYDAAELLLRGVTQILREGLGPLPDDSRGYIVEKLNASLRRLGLKVVKERDESKP